MRFGELRVQAHGFQQQAPRLLGLSIHPVELGQMIIGARIRRLPLEPCELLLHVDASLVIERDIDDLTTPEAHLRAPTRMIRTSITFVFVGPVRMRSPKESK